MTTNLSKGLPTATYAKKAAGPVTVSQASQNGAKITNDDKRVGQLQKSVAAQQPQHSELQALDPASRDEVGRIPSRGRGVRTMRTWAFLLAVVLPTLVTSVYFLFLAADRYETEAKFVVRSPGSALMGELAGIVQGSSITRSSDDAYIVHAFIKSREAMKILSRDANLLEILDRPALDLLWRYPGFIRRHSDERLQKYLRSIVHIAFDHTTGISTLKVQAFRPEDAQQIALVLLREAERLINRLSERGQKDSLAIARREVESSKQTAVAAQRRLTAFRTRYAVIDPGKVSTAAQETISRLAFEKAQTSAQLLELRQSSPNSPQVGVYRIRIAALEAQIAQERKALAGTDASLAPLLAEYEGLALERTFAERSFGSALTALELARMDTQRQRLFLEQISRPTIPDIPHYPYRILSILIVLAIGAAIFSIVVRFVVDTAAHGGR